MTHRSIRPALMIGLTLLGALALLAGVLAPRGAQANGVPQVVELGYLAPLSNWGPTDATGTLEFSFAEGLLDLTATGLPRLAGQTYEGWLVRSTTNDVVSVGQFNASASGTTRYSVQLPPITDYSLDLFILTVQSLDEPSSAPSQLRSIGGYFSVVEPAPVAEGGNSDIGNPDASNPPSGSSGTGSGAAGGETSHSAGTGSSATPPAGGTAAGQQPATLPNTGDTEGFLGDLRGTALILAGGAAIILAGIRTRIRVRRGLK